MTAASQRAEPFTGIRVDRQAPPPGRLPDETHRGRVHAPDRRLTAVVDVVVLVERGQAGELTPARRAQAGTHGSPHRATVSGCR